MEDLWIDRLGKADIERMYKMAYTIDAEIYRPDDVVDFGIDLRRLKEFGEVEMKKDLAQLRRRANGLWGRMNRHQKSAYWIGDVVAALRTATCALRSLEALIGRLDESHDGIEMTYNGLFARSGALKERVEKGVGKWRANGEPR